MTIDDELDALGLLCPLPVLKTRKRLQALSSGQVILVRSDDPAAMIDMPHFCDQQGHELIEMDQDQQGQTFLIRKGS